MSLEELIKSYGYLALFVGTFLEGETILIIAAFMATPAQGLLKLHWAMLAAFSGSFLGDELAFFIGRFKGKGFVARRPKLQAKAQRVYGLLEKYHTLIILGFRFMYGLRNMIPFALGMSRVDTKRFMALNAVGAGAWAFTYAMIGYLFGTAVETILGDIKRYQLEVLAAVAGLALLIWTVQRLIRRKTARSPQVDAADAHEQPAPDKPPEEGRS